MVRQYCLILKPASLPLGIRRTSPETDWLTVAADEVTSIGSHADESMLTSETLIEIAQVE